MLPCRMKLAARSQSFPIPGKEPGCQELHDWDPMQVHEKEDVELDVLNLKGRENALEQDQGHIIDSSAEKPDKNAKQGRKAKASATPPSAGQQRGFKSGRFRIPYPVSKGALRRVEQGSAELLVSTGKAVILEMQLRTGCCML